MPLCRQRCSVAHHCRKGVTSRVTEFFRFYILTTRFTRKVATLVILWLYLVLFHEFVTGRAFVYLLAWYAAALGTSFMSLVTLCRSASSLAILTNTYLLLFTVIRQTNTAVILTSVSMFVIIRGQTRLTRRTEIRSWKKPHILTMAWKCPESLSMWYKNIFFSFLVAVLADVWKCVTESRAYDINVCIKIIF